MNPDALFTDGNVCGMGINPASAIEIIDSVFMLMQGGVGVAAEDARRPMMLSVRNGSGRHFWGQAQPARIQPVEETSDCFILRVPLLQLQVKQRADQIAAAPFPHEK